jgi:hypothetical protein
VFNPHHHALQAVNEALHQAPVTPPDGTVAVLVPPPPPPNRAQELAHQRRAQRLALYQQIWALHRQRWPGHAIATQLGIAKNTVFHYLSTPRFPSASRAVTAAAVSSRPLPRIASNAGRRGAATPCDSSESSNRMATPAVMSPSPATPSACARRRARHLDSDDHATPCRL